MVKLPQNQTAPNMASHLPVARSGKNVMNEPRWCAGLHPAWEVRPHALVQIHEVA